MPRCLIELASSSSWAAGNSRRGLRGLGRRNSIGTRRWLRTRSEAAALLSAPISPIRDAKPRPSRDRVDSSAIADSPAKSFTSFVSFHPHPTLAGLARARRGSVCYGSDQFPLAPDDLGRETQIGLAAHAFEV